MSPSDPHVGARALVYRTIKNGRIRLLNICIFYHDGVNGDTHRRTLIESAAGRIAAIDRLLVKLATFDLAVGGEDVNVCDLLLRNKSDGKEIGHAKCNENDIAFEAACFKH